MSINTYNEKTLHLFLKKRYEPDEQYHEISCCGYIADIKRGSSIFEIQTAQIYRMKDKLRAFLEENEVTVVYPIPHIKQLVWVDPDNGEMSPPRRSPKVGTEYDLFKELHYAREILGLPGLSFAAVLVDVTEYRYLNGHGKDRKKRSVRAERIPNGIYKEVFLREKNDYAALIPAKLGKQFTVPELAAAAKIDRRLAQCTVSVLTLLGVTEHIGKQGRCYLYEVKR